MPHTNFRLPLLAFLLVLIVACTEQPATTPTLAPPPTVTVAQPTTAPDATQTGAPPPATASSEPPPPTTGAATASPDAPTPTLAAEATGTAQPSPEAETFSVTEPEAGASWATGSAVTVSGRAPADTGSVVATLRAAGLQLASAETAPSGGDWQMTLDLPDNVTGTALLEFAVDGEPAVAIPVALALPGATSDSAITLDHPQMSSPVVSGHVLFFTGRVQRPPSEMLTIAILYEDCQTVASTTTFNVGEGGQWWGYIVVPETVFGPACAIAYLSEFDAPGWRAAHAPITILEMEDPEARGLFIGNFAGSELTPGDSVTVYGSAYNVPDRQVRVSLQLGGEAIAQGTTTADPFGYWEINLAVPADVPVAEGEFRAAVSYDGEEVSETVPFEITP